MFKKQTLDTILGTFTKTMKDLENYIEGCYKDISTRNEQVRIATENIEISTANKDKARRVLENLSKIVEGDKDEVANKV